MVSMASEKPLPPCVANGMTVLPDETAESAVEFLWFAVAWYAGHGIKVERVLTDNGSCSTSWKFRKACCELGIKHKRTRPYHLNLVVRRNGSSGRP